LIANEIPQKWISFKSKAISGEPSKIFLMGDHDL
jgi:3',5'-cyclic AMP phosphodiesterase CpdA